MSDMLTQPQTAQPEPAESDPTKACPGDLAEEKQYAHDLPASERTEDERKC